MANSKGVNKTLIDANKMAHIGEINGHKKVLFDEITLDRNVYAISDTLEMGGKLPVGARVLSAGVKCPSMGTTGIFNFGYLASEDGAEAADPNGFADGLDAGGQAVQANNDPADGIGKKFTAPVQPVITFSEASDAANGLKVQAWLEYIVD